MAACIIYHLNSHNAFGGNAVLCLLVVVCIRWCLHWQLCCLSSFSAWTASTGICKSQCLQNDHCCKYCFSTQHCCSVKYVRILNGVLVFAAHSLQCLSFCLWIWIRFSFWASMETWTTHCCKSCSSLGSGQLLHGGNTSSDTCMSGDNRALFSSWLHAVMM